MHWALQSFRITFAGCGHWFEEEQSGVSTGSWLFIIDKRGASFTRNPQSLHAHPQPAETQGLSFFPIFTISSSIYDLRAVVSNAKPAAAHLKIRKTEADTFSQLLKRTPKQIVLFTVFIEGAHIHNMPSLHLLQHGWGSARKAASNSRQTTGLQTQSPRTPSSSRQLCLLVLQPRLF